MPMVKALQGFEHAGTRKRGERFMVSEQHAKQLERAGLVEVDGKRPKKAAGKKSSASRAAQASRQTTAKKSGGGGKKRKAAASSS